uniref:Uncharacterized protein n=1 Tax=Candidatus Kentrum sp. MB TaxID=2138164 RepID=A0A450XR00_9GAMM|nr:MAG: hypothetical protein BECKMB1821G_GA0114241_10149 [Candidatus Kentron sp. MB]VFK31686.1 MAG: hypothetical protein BECKMB1821I_GA0114274_102611 [Candidatus Kentron sp. MB]VFK75611.1 MAG: hypothetical protein BECKMB1821H_GA0114242_102710 [Candidatus Kentron sp. MB]
MMRWISTPDSVEQNQPTVLAITETVLAVAAYWGIAWAFDTHLHLLMSICVAPLLLLRSPESTDKGVRWFVAYLEDKTEITRKGAPVRFWGIVLPTVIIAGAFAYGLAPHLLVGQDGWVLFARAMGLGALGWPIAIMVTAAGAAAGAVAVTAAGAGAIAGAIAGAGAVAAAGAGAGAKIAFIALFLIPFAVGIWLRSLGVRLAATLRHPIRGLKKLPENWRRILWALDSHHAPELVPGLSARNDLSSALSLSGMVEKIRAEDDWTDRLVLLPLLPIFFLPGLLYRWSLKSTCWLYLPLIYLGGGLRLQPHTPEEKGWLVVGLYESRVESLRRWLALAVLVSALLTTALNHPAFQSTIENSLSQFPRVLQFYLWIIERLTEQASALAYLWAFNLVDLAPWQWLNLLGAALTGGLWIYSDRVHRIWTLAKEKDPDAAPRDIHITWLLQMTRARNLCAIVYVFLAFGYCILALGGLEDVTLTGWLAPLDVLYGPYL